MPPSKFVAVLFADRWLDLVACFSAREGRLPLTNKYLNFCTVAWRIQRLFCLLSAKGQILFSGNRKDAYYEYIDKKRGFEKILWLHKTHSSSSHNHLWSWIAEKVLMARHRWRENVHPNGKGIALPITTTFLLPNTETLLVMVSACSLLSGLIASKDLVLFCIFFIGFVLTDIPVSLAKNRTCVSVKNQVSVVRVTRKLSKKKAKELWSNYPLLISWMWHHDKTAKISQLWDASIMML